MGCKSQRSGLSRVLLGWTITSTTRGGSLLVGDDFSLFLFVWTFTLKKCGKMMFTVHPKSGLENHIFNIGVAQPIWKPLNFMRWTEGTIVAVFPLCRLHETAIQCEMWILFLNSISDRCWYIGHVRKVPFKHLFTWKGYNISRYLDVME